MLTILKKRIRFSPTITVWESEAQWMLQYLIRLKTINGNKIEPTIGHGILTFQVAKTQPAKQPPGMEQHTLNFFPTYSAHTHLSLHHD